MQACPPGAPCHGEASPRPAPGAREVGRARRLPTPDQPLELGPRGRSHERAARARFRAIRGGRTTNTNDSKHDAKAEKESLR
jgi:hypothetical protein